jgi:beta-galactosidase
LAKVISPFLEVNGGNIILIQIENEFGSLSEDSQHTFNLLKMWADLGVKSNFYYEDAAQWSGKHYWPGASLGISEGHHLYEY